MNKENGPAVKNGIKDNNLCSGMGDFKEFRRPPEE
jgi:hypothetical protein